MTNTKDNPSKGIFVSPWTYEDVDLCLTDTSVTLTDTQKDECLQDLIDLLSDSVGMEYLREIVANEIESCRENKKWSHIGVEMPLSDVKRLFSILSSEMDNTNDVKPIAHVRKGGKHKVITKPEDGWDIVVCNAVFINDGKNGPLRVQRGVK